VRRFINSLPGFIVSRVAALTLIMPYVTLATYTRAVAQVETRPQYAVLDFSDMKVGGVGPYGVMAATQVATAFAATDTVDPLPAEQIHRTEEQLGLTSPVTEATSVARLAQVLHADTVVSGELLNYRVRSVPGGKQADVLMRVIVTDVASGLGVNGAALAAHSTVRSGDTSDDTLIQEAVSLGAQQAVQTIVGQTLPTGTVLNTLDNAAYINQGARTGFKVGQELIVTRYHEQVATAKVTDIEPDQSRIVTEREFKGVQPGDKVRVIFQVPTISDQFAGDNGASVQHNRAHGDNAGLIQVLLLIGLLMILLANGHGGSNDVFTGVKAEPTIYPANSGQIAVKVSWGTDLFAKGNQTRVAFQVWRDDIVTSPVVVTPGNQLSVYDVASATTVNWYSIPNPGDLQDCNGIIAPTAATITGPVAGRPYIYSVELVYALASIDLPNGGTSGTTTGGTAGTAGTAGSTGVTSGGTGTTTGGTTTGTAGGLTTGGGTTGTTTTGGATTGGTATTGNTAGGTGATLCYFVSQRHTAPGTATPLNQPTLITPQQNAVVSASIPFSFNSAVTSFPITVNYVVQLSPSQSFPQGTTFTTPLITSPATGILSTKRIDIPNTDVNDPSLVIKVPAFITNATTVWWRVGAANANDSPGPVPDVNGQRYIWSAPRSFTRPPHPPGGP